MDAPKLLHIETATPVASVALSEGPVAVASLTMQVDKGHARLLAPMIRQCLDHAQWSFADLDGIAVSGGPGSYTGLRVGVSTAKGISVASGLPMIAVSSPAAIAGTVLDLAESLSATIVPMIDARRMEVYLGRFAADGLELNPIEARIMEEGSLTDWLEEGPTLFVGDGVEKCTDLLRSHPHAILLPQRFSDATGLIPFALQAFEQGDFVDTEGFEPFYLKSVRVTKPRNKLLG